MDIGRRSVHHTTLIRPYLDVKEVFLLSSLVPCFNWSENDDSRYGGIRKYGQEITAIFRSQLLVFHLFMEDTQFFEVSFIIRQLFSQGNLDPA